MKLKTTVNAHMRLCGHLLTEEGRIAWSPDAQLALGRSDLFTGMGWLGWDETNIPTKKIGAEEYSPMGQALNWLYSIRQGGKKPWLWIYGESYGVGKTHIATVLGYLWVAIAERPALEVSWGEYIETQKASWSSNSEPVTNIDEMIRAPFLIIDDICGGSGFSSKWALGQMFVLIDSRKGPTVFTSNLSPGHYRSLIKRGASGRDHKDIAGKVDDRLGRGDAGKLATPILVSGKSRRSK